MQVSQQARGTAELQAVPTVTHQKGSSHLAAALGTRDVPPAAAPVPPPGAIPPSRAAAVSQPAQGTAHTPQPKAKQNTSRHFNPCYKLTEKLTESAFASFLSSHTIREVAGGASWGCSAELPPHCPSAPPHTPGCCCTSTGNEAFPWAGTGQGARAGREKRQQSRTWQI